MPCALEINSNGILKQGYVESCPSTTKTSNLRCHNASGLQTWQGGELPRGAPTHKINGPFVLDHAKSGDKLKS